VTVTPTFGVRPVAALSLQFWSDVHSVFAVQASKQASGITNSMIIKLPIYM